MQKIHTQLRSAEKVVAVPRKRKSPQPGKMAYLVVDREGKLRRLAHPARDLTMQRFGRWTVLYPTHIKRTCVYWLCRCDCGTERRVNGSGLTAGISKSCGCLQRELVSKRVRTHGATNTLLFKLWHAMRCRCYYKAGYKKRGIKVDPAWDSFVQFAADMGPRPSPKHSIERKDNNGPYAAWNCVWALPEVQHNNKSTNRFVELNGQRLTISQAARVLGIKYNTLHERLRRGWNIQTALQKPVQTYVYSTTSA